MYSRNAVTAILVVDVTNQASFEKLDVWLDIVQANCARDCRIYIVANKIDLDIAIPIQELEKRVAAQGAPFFRTCAKQYETVAPLFEKAGDDIITSRKANLRGPDKQVSPVLTGHNSEHKSC
jgi:GTPase SAR1 family protein